MAPEFLRLDVVAIVTEGMDIVSPSVVAYAAFMVPWVNGNHYQLSADDYLRETKGSRIKIETVRSIEQLKS